MSSIVTYLINILAWLNNVITSLLFHLNEAIEKLVFFDNISFPILIILSVLCVLCTGLLLYFSIENNTDISKKDEAGGSNGT